jgi:hypothetical protein
MIDRMLARGDLWERYRGVYVVGRPGLTDYGEAWAAVMACRGEGRAPHVRALGLRSAIAALGLGEHPRRPEIVIVGARLEIPGVVIRRTRSLRRDEVDLDHNRLPWTTFPRTITDLAAGASLRDLEKFLAAADAERMLDVGAIDAAIGRARGRAGLGRLREALELYRDLPEAEFLSRLERLANRVLVPAGMPQPEINGDVTLLDGQVVRVDLLLRDQRLAIELDGRRTHDRKVQFQVDRWRDRELQKLGFVVLRFTWRDVVRDPDRFVADVVAFLDRGVGFRHR